MDFVNIFITFTGRINRAKYWIAVICCAVFLLAVVGVTITVASSIDTVFRAALIAYVPLIYVGVVTGIKRLHDRNKSGWWIVLLYGGPMLLSWIGAVISNSAGIFIQLIGLIISLWGLVELGFLRGTIGSNRYGPDPLAPEVLTPPVRTHA